MVLYDNDLICIFMNINENLELRKTIGYTSKGVCVCVCFFLFFFCFVFFVCFILGGGEQADLH